MSTAPGGLPTPRLQRLAVAVADRGLDAVVLVGKELVAWASGYERWLGGPYALLVETDARKTLVLPAYEEEVAGQSGEFDAVVTFSDRTLGLDLDLAGGRDRRLRDLVAGRRVGFAGEATPVAVGAEDLTALVHHIRLRKDAAEVAALREAFADALAGQRAVAEAATPGVTEIELFSVAHAAAQQRAGRPLGFMCDLVSGPRAGAAFGPVNVAGTRVLARNDWVVVDVAVGSAYWGDSARTILIGEVDEELAEARAQIAAVLDNVAARLVPETRCADVYEWMRTEIAQRLPGWVFPHHAGHGVGASVFEDPHLIPADHTRLEAGMVLAVEPGAYRPGHYGVRVEDMFVVGAAGGAALGS